MVLLVTAASRRLLISDIVCGSCMGQLGVIALCRAHLTVVVLPLTSPSRVQCGRYAIHGFACHSSIEALVDQ